MLLQTPLIKDAGGGGHFEGKRGKETCGRKDLKDHLETAGEGRGAISSR